MKFTLTVDMDNEAFEHGRSQLRDILADVRYAVTDPRAVDGRVRDYNGNTCGSWEITGD